jgi:NAD-dependent deacetylase
LDDDDKQPSKLVDHALERASSMLRVARSIAVFTGAGVSAESGIPTFRDGDGLWSRFPPERFARWQSLEQLIRHKPLLVAEFVLELLHPIVSARPNSAHEAIANLERLNKEAVVITQNIDGLHQRAGSTLVAEIHGSGSK